MTRYVAGFAFDGKMVALIEKQRPLWQKGLLNGIGGHIEEGEEPIDAMVREFREETGVNTMPHEWDRFATLTDGVNFEVTFFKTWCVDIAKLKTKTDEKVVIFPTEKVNVFNCIPNLTWLIPMAKSMPWDSAWAFTVMEEHA